jgi:DNA-directed RNA polymerase sigma subunit (sigma70/sigma32)
MPGFLERSSTDRQKAFEDGIKLAERRSGKKYVDTPEAKKKRREVNGGTMYKTSASVPESMIQFANEIHEIERITPKEEIFLGEQTQEAIRIQKIYDGLIAQLDREPTDAEWCAASGKINMESLSQTIEEGLEAKNKLVTSNLRMVQGVVNVYIRNGLSGQYNAGDLMQEGIMVRAIFCLGILGSLYGRKTQLLALLTAGLDSSRREV